MSKVRTINDDYRTGALIDKIVRWHYDRNLIEGSTSIKQFSKLQEEVMELKHNLEYDGDIRDDVGDIIVVLINILEREGISLKECLEVAYSDIKNRKGKMVEGVFVKEVIPAPPTEFKPEEE